jgi:uncharacterized membrane protein YuzA (DUF378 family)
MISGSYPFADFMSLLIILIAAISYGIAGIFGTDWIRWIDPFPPTVAILVGASGVWQLLRQPWFE